MNVDQNRISLEEWSDASRVNPDSHAALFNSAAMARANLLEQHQPLSLVIDGVSYLAYRRNASLVVNALSVAHGVTLLKGLEQLKASGRKFGVRAVAWNTLNAQDDPAALKEALRLGATLRYEFVLDADTYAISGLSSNHKRNIRKSEKAGASLQLPTGPEAVRGHIALVNRNLEGKGVGGLSNSPEYFSSLIDSGSGMLAQVVDQGEVQGSTFFIIDKDFAYYHSSGTTDHGKKIGAAHYLVDQVIAKMKLNGMRFMNLGGSTPGQDGLLRFKQGFRPGVNLLAAAGGRLDSPARQKIRALLAVRPRDILAVKRTAIYERPVVDQDPSAEHGWTLAPLDGAGLVDTVSAHPGIGGALEFYYRRPSICYAIYDEKQALAGLAFLADAGNAGTIEILRIESALLKDKRLGVQRLLDLLLPEVRRLGYDNLKLNISVADDDLRDIAHAAGCVCSGQRRTLVSSLFWGETPAVQVLQV